MASEFIEHGPCEKCGSGDANAYYDDGHSHCFSCDTTSGGTPRPKDTTVKDWTPLTGEFHDLRRRRISQEICKKFGYLTTFGGETLQIAEYRDLDRKLVGQKIRDKDKSFRSLGTVQDALYGMHLWGTGGKRIVITEGEIDTLSYAEATKGSWPVVSVPNGAQSARKALAKHLEWLESYDEIVIAFDNDEPGQEAAKACAHLFTPGKCKVARLDPTYKDFNDALVNGNPKCLLEAVWNAQDTRPDGILAGGDLWDTLSDLSQTESCEYPWPGLNALTHGLRKGELVTLTAGSGIGKSAFCKEIAYDLAMRQGRKVGCVFLEENVKRTAMGLMGLYANQPLHLRTDLGDDDLPLIQEAYNATLANNRFFFFDHFGSTDLENLLSRIRYLALACDVDFVILDHISIVISGLDVQDERRAIDMAMTELRTLVERTGIGLVLVSHLKRPQGENGHENGVDPQLSHLRGSHAIAQLSDMVVGLSRDQQCAEGKRDITKLIVLKNRFSGETGYSGDVKYDHVTGRLHNVITSGSGKEFDTQIDEEF